MRLISLLLLYSAAYFSTTGCSQLISSAKKDFAEDLSSTIMEQKDPETVKQAIPTFLVLVSSMIRGDDENIDLLVSGSKLYGSYASVFVDDAERKQVLSNQSYDYALRAICLTKTTACSLQSASFFEFEQIVNTFNKENIAVLFALGSAWGGQIQANSSDWNALADLPKVKVIIAKVLALDEKFSNGDAHLYMAVMQSFLPPAMGGKPELAKHHFERALEISDGKNLMALLFYAEKYARLVFDKELHDRLLKQLLESNIDVSESTLINTIAKSKAKILLEESDDYF